MDYFKWLYQLMLDTDLFYLLFAGAWLWFLSEFYMRWKNKVERGKY